MLLNVNMNKLLGWNDMLTKLNEHTAAVENCQGTFLKT